MRIRGMLAVAGVALVGSVTAALSIGTPPPPALAESSTPLAASSDDPATGTVGLVAPAARPSRGPHAYTPPAPVTFEPPPAVAEKLSPMPVSLSALGIPELVLSAYRAAESTLAVEQPGCGVTWHLLAGIGRIESGHAGGGRTDAAGTTLTPILGPVLNGSLAGNNVVSDTDGGKLDGDPKFDRAVGPMQFLPGTWAHYAADGNGDGVSDPNNVFDASLAAARYLCSGGLNLRDSAQEVRAVLRYNNSMAYAANVLAWSAAYAGGGTPTPGSIPEVAPEPGKPAEPTPTPGKPAPAVLADAATPAPVAPTPPPLIPGLPALPCLIFCPPAPAVPAAPVVGIAPGPGPAAPPAPAPQSPAPPTPVR
ncbi:lytic transglycosylase [Rhodococcus spelaei]|uniref:Lytic transglycosylase n=1 Tax=Rhodococcus spelaei TaxID=2546320 RepID=A0A541AZS6_9NOCA|nr:lytic murein transglycosylase [Rhodococcus spelaei]TQF65544.1 lytic transglycosylase [Rhodococcus spelaei]